MPIISGQISLHGPIIPIRVGVSKNRDMALKKNGMTVPPKLARRALIDTGSFLTAFPADVFRLLQIEPFSTAKVRTPSTKRGEPFECEVYDISLELGAGGLLPSVRAIVATDFDDAEDDDGVHALLGRDVLQCCNFSYFGPSLTFQLAF